MATEQISLLHQINMHLKKNHLVSNMVGTISHTGFHHKWCTGIAVNVLCSDNTVCNCLHMTKYVRDMT